MDNFTIALRNLNPNDLGRSADCFRVIGEYFYRINKGPEARNLMRIARSLDAAAETVFSGFRTVA